MADDIGMRSSRASWTAAELAADSSWKIDFDDSARDDLLQELHRLFVPGKPLIAYDAKDIDLGRATAPVSRAMREALAGRGVALLRRLPREGLSEEQFAFLTWMTGLQQGVPRPQNKNTQYLSAVRDIGTDYRSPTGRGYSSNAELDFHIDGADIVALTCYNVARHGGLSTLVSNGAVYNALKRDHPDLLPLFFELYHFSLQGEQPAGAPPSVRSPIFMEANDNIFIRWVRNRVESAQTLEGVPKLDDQHWHALATLDEVIRRPEHVASMMLEPGDMQILNNYRCLHSRTEFQDFEEPERKRLLFRLWLSVPNGEQLPQSIAGDAALAPPNVVRGGMLGQKYDEACQAFDERQAAFHNMVLPKRRSAAA